MPKAADVSNMMKTGKWPLALKTLARTFSVNGGRKKPDWSWVGEKEEVANPDKSVKDSWSW